MLAKTICVLGGTGFVGHHLVSQLSQKGFQVRVPSRNRERRRSLTVLPNVQVTDCNIFDENQLTQLFDGCDVVINLVAILNENKRGDFERVHVELPNTIAKACWATSVTRVLHMSALNADAAKGPSAYLRTKGAGENGIHDADGLNVTSFRPSLIFGHDDHFFTTFAKILRHLPMMPVPCPASRFAPIFVGDLVKAMVDSINDSRTFGQRYELCGPKVYTMEELANYAARLVNPKRRIVPLGDGLSSLQGRIMGLLPFKPFSHDNFLSLQVDAVCARPIPAIFDFAPTTMESVVPYYIGQADIRGRYDTIRQTAARDPE